MHTPSSSMRHRLASVLQQWRQQWRRLQLRERRMVALAAALVAMALLWLVLLAPALRTLRAAPAQQAQLDQQLTRMRSLQAQAQALQQLPRMGADESRQQLIALSQKLLGDNSLTVQGNQATAQLRNVPPRQLAEWLQQARMVARALPQQARIEYGPAGWNGSITLRLAGA